MSGGQSRAVGIPTWTLGDRLRKVRTLAGLEREYFARIFDCDPKTVGNYENDRTHPPKLVVREYALRCGVPMLWLLTGNEPGPDDEPDPSTIWYDVPPSVIELAVAV